MSAISDRQGTLTGFTYVHEAVRRQAEMRPSAPALIDEAGRVVDYGELATRSGRLARRLQRLGVGPDGRVAVWMERSAEVIVSMLGVMEAGGAYVPIDASYPEERAAVMLEGSGAKVLISERGLPSGVTGVKVIRPEAACSESDSQLDSGLDSEFDARLDARLDSGIQAGLDEDNLAYVIYTSGSTGSPKGVAMTHRGLSRLIRWQIQDGPPALSTLQFTPICFDVSFQEVFSTLCTGGSLLLVSDSLRRDPDRLLASLDQRAIQRLFLPYVALQQLAKASSRRGLRPHALRHVITAGERLIVTEAISELFSALPGCRLDNHYGPTEAHLITSFTLGPTPSDWPGLPPIGAAVGGVSLYNLDGRLDPVAEGEVGELYAGGSGLARGYLDAPDLTAERFLPDPFSREGGARMYRTGDLVEVGGDGVARFVGRADGQIKVRGYRVEPGEVELALTDHPLVREAAVGLREIAADVPALVAYVAADGSRVSAGELTRHVRGRLPDYMTPARYVFVEALPLTPSGKVDHRLLSALEIVDSASAQSAPAQSAPAQSAGGQSASDPAAGGVAVGAETLLEMVRSIWERVLGHDELDESDDFFDVGGDSLLATWVVTELSSALGRDIELSALLHDSTMGGIARTLEGLAVSKAGARRTSEVITLRAGPSQRALILVHPLGGEVVAYRGLARAMRARLRVLGLRWRPEGAVGASAMTMEEMAAVHLAEVRAIQPVGPYLLGGWSFGGVLAYEMAQQIVASGERVEFLGLLDANPVLDPTSGVVTRESPLLGRLEKAIEEMERKAEAGEGGYELAKLLADPQLGALLGSTIPEGVTAAHISKNLRMTRDNLRAAMSYRAAGYAGAVELFEPEGSAGELRNRLAGELGKLVLGGVRRHEVGGNHYSMLRAPLVEGMAKAVDAALESISHD